MACAAIFELFKILDKGRLSSPPPSIVNGGLRLPQRCNNVPDVSGYVLYRVVGTLEWAPAIHEITDNPM